MVENHYRWDFIGLSTDEKPTPATSEKVVDGSTFYCSDNSKLYVFYKDTWYEKTVSGGGGGTSDFDQLTNRPKYNGTTMDSTTNIPEVKTYSDFTGTDGTAAGAAGLVPAPATTDAGKFLKADGTWDTAGGSSVTVVQTTGTSTSDVMSQNATTSMVYADPSTKVHIRIGDGASTGTSANNGFIAIGKNAQATNSGSGAGATAIGAYTVVNNNFGIAIGAGNSNDVTTSSGNNSIAIGSGSTTSGNCSIALGAKANASGAGSVALGVYSTATAKGTVSIDVNPSYASSFGYNNSNYRLLTGLYDGQTDHDAVTVGQINATIDAINTALSTNIPHIGA